MRCRAQPCGAAALCCAVLCRAACSGVLALSYNAWYHSSYHTRYRYYYGRFVRPALLNRTKCTPSSQLSPAIVQKRSAAPGGTVRRRAFPRGAVLCRAALLCFLSNMLYQVSSEVPARPGTGMYACILSLGFLPLTVFRKIHPYYRSERDIANNHIAQHREVSSAQAALGIIKSRVAPMTGLFFLPSSRL